jgi:hypothetical protein
MEDSDLHGMKWPAHSPDPNIIENAWHKIQKRTTKTSSKHHVSCLETAIRNIWTEMPIVYIQDLYKSISKRLKYVIIKFIDCFKNVITCLSVNLRMFITNMAL